MVTLFDAAANEEVLSRVEKLQPSLRPNWGKLKIEEMLAHLNLSFEVNFGRMELKRSLMGVFFRGISKKILLGEKPFPKNLPTDKKTLAKGASDFWEEKQKLQNNIKQYAHKGSEILSKNPHNILGKITPEESAYISYKHLDHHLRQFGV